jgi:regulator of sigma E protease
MTILNIIYVVFAMLLLFGAAVFVHEYGHYWMARKRGMKVEEFAIGFGPKIFSWMHDGVVWSWRWIPAGGFVKLPQMITSETLEGGANKEEPIPPASPLSKILVAFAGPFMNIVFAFVIATLIYFIGLPVAVNPSIIGYVEKDSAEAQLGIKEGDRIVSVNGEKVKSWQDVSMFTILARTNVLPVVIEQGKEQKTFMLTAKVNESLGLKLLNLDPRDHPEIIEVQSDSAAEAAGLKAGDKILSFNALPAASREQLIDLIKKRGGQATEIRVQRGAEKLTLTVTPKEDPTTKIGRIGTVLGSSSSQMYVVQRPGPTPWAQVSDVVDKTIKTISALVHSKQTGVGAKDLSGPVGILTILAAQVNTDYRLALSFLVLLNVNLAIINLLPMPVLDGGHILMAIIEKIRRRPLSQKFVEYTSTVFAVVLISFMLYVTFFDLKRFPLFKAMFKGGHQIEEPQSQGAPPAP